MNRSFHEQAEELRKEIEDRKIGYAKWLKLWAQEKSPFKVGQTFISSDGEYMEITEVTANYLVDGKYEWVIRGLVDTHVAKRSLCSYTIPMETEEE